MDDAVDKIDFTGVRHAFMKHSGEWTATIASFGAGPDAFVLGSTVDGFETDFATYLGVQHCVGVANGLDALTLLLKAHGIGQGDEVIVPAQTFHATYLSVIAAGATPRPVEVLSDSGNIDPKAVEAAVSARTAAVIAVHLHGNPCDMESLQRVTHRQGLLLLEDAAQAHGGRLPSGMLGALGDGSAFSFYPTKNLGALGDGGCVATDDAVIAERVRSWRSYSPVHVKGLEILGGNSRLDTVQAAWLQLTLPCLDAWNERRREVASEYWSLLHPSGVLPLHTFPNESVWHHFTIRVANQYALYEALKRVGIPTHVHYPTPAYARPEFRQHFPLNLSSGAFPVADCRSKCLLSLPMHPWLSNDQVQFISSHVLKHGNPHP